MTPELKKACELIFQEHKSLGQPVNWHKDSFRGRISIGLSEIAKETLLKKRIIHFTHPGKKTITVLDPEVTPAATFEEALIIVESKMPVLVDTSEKKPVRVIDDFADYIEEPEEIEQPAVRWIKVTGEADVVIAPVKWYTRPLFYYVIGPLCAAALGILIAFFLSEYITKLLQ
jgi:hypothetical protein